MQINLLLSWLTDLERNEQQAKLHEQLPAISCISCEYTSLILNGFFSCLTIMERLLLAKEKNLKSTDARAHTKMKCFSVGKVTNMQSFHDRSNTHPPPGNAMSHVHDMSEDSS